jgi:predicted ester cyclase
MSAREIKGLVQRLFEASNKSLSAYFAVADETLAADYVIHGVMGEDIRGLKELKQYVSSVYEAFPDSHRTIDDIIVEGDKAAVRFTATGTHTGAFMGIPPTNKKITYWAIEINRFSGGKLVETWGRLDTLGLMQQLGVVPTPKV